MTCKQPIHGAWTLIRVCPWNGEQIIMGVFPEGKAALLKLEHFMDSPEDNEEYKIEYHIFQSHEQLLESHRKSDENRAEWKLKDTLLENYKKEKEEQEELNKEYNEEHGYVASDT